MNFFGIGGLELVLVMLVALFVLGPVRLVQGARTARKYMTELRRQREQLTQMVEEAVDVEGVKERLDQDGVMDAVRDFSDELNRFQDEARMVSSDVTDLKNLANSVTRPEGNRRVRSNTDGRSVNDAETDTSPKSTTPKNVNNGRGNTGNE